MTEKKKLLMNFLWFLIGMSAIVAIPLLIIEHCSQPRQAEIRENQGQKQSSVDHSNEKQVIGGNQIITCRLA